MGLWAVFSLAVPRLVAAQTTLHMAPNAVLSLDPPAAGASTQTISTRIGNGKEVVLATFTSAPLSAELVVPVSRAVVYLATGRLGMDGCATVQTSLSRLSGAGETAVASGSLLTTLHPRRQVIEPIVVAMMAAAEPPLAAGDRLVAQIGIRNTCGEARDVFLSFGSIGRDSRIDVDAPGATTTTTSTTTTTVPPLCALATTALSGVRCRLEEMHAILRATSPALLGGNRSRRRLERGVDRALTLVRAAERGRATLRRLRRTQKVLARISILVANGLADGRLAPEVADPLMSLVQGATAELTTALAGA